MDPAGPKPCASVPGTTLVVEDLFYNVSTRKQVRRLHCFSSYPALLFEYCMYAGIEKQQ